MHAHERAATMHAVAEPMVAEPFLDEAIESDQDRGDDSFCGAEGT